MATYFKDKNVLLSVFSLCLVWFLGDVVHDVLGRNRLPSPRLATDDGTLQETKHNFKQEFGALTKELSSRMLV
jgi:hypothetical protein